VTAPDTTPNADADTGAEDYDAILSNLEADRDHHRQRAEMAETALGELQQRVETAETAAREAQAALEAAQQAAQDDSEATEPTPEGDDSGQQENEPQDETGRKPAGVRQRLAEAEAERDALRERLSAQRTAVYEDAIARAGVTGLLMSAAGHTAETLAGEDGVIDPGAVVETAQQVAAEAGIPRRPKADPMLGRGNQPVPEKVTFGSLLKATVGPGKV